MFDEKQNSKKKFFARGGLLNVYVVFRGGLPNVYVYLQGGRGGQKWPKSCLRSKSMTPKILHKTRIEKNYMDFHIHENMAHFKAFLLIFLKSARSIEGNTL